MTKKTHIASGLVVTTSVLMITKEVNVVCMLGIVGTIVPDFDMVLGMKHRGISHSFITAIGLGAILSLFNSIFALSFVLNYCLHIALDSFTKMKVPAYAPFDKGYYGAGWIKTGGTEDLFLCLSLITLFGWMINLI